MTDSPPLLPYLATVERPGAGAAGDEPSFRWKGVLAAGDPVYAGHFPGRPILAAIAQLEMARAAASLASGQPLALTAIDVLKLRRTIGPGDAIGLELRPLDAEGGGHPLRFAFTLTGPGESPVSSGTLGFHPAGTAAPLPAPPPAPGSRLLPVAADPAPLLPHAPPARFLLGAAEASAEGLACDAAVPSGHALAVEGEAPSFAALEAGAQAAGLLEALGRSAAGDGAPAVGYVVGLRGVSLDPRPIAAGVPFRIKVRRSGGAGALAVYEVEAEAGGRTAARGTVSAFLPTAAAEEGS